MGPGPSRRGDTTLPSPADGSPRAENAHGSRTNLQCKDCKYWYGAEDDEYGPCQLKHARNDPKFVTFGAHDCDEPAALAEYGVTR
ncbi:MAG: hypothetical protein ACYDCK_04605 [Thermoplasmatota archaeon]